MVYGVIRSFQAALKYRGGWKGLLEHMYTVSCSVSFAVQVWSWIERGYHLGCYVIFVEALVDLTSAVMVVLCA